MPIVVEKLSHTYMAGSDLAFRSLNSIDLTVNEGEFLGVIGHTGSGKSTLIQHLNGLIPPTEGRVLVDGYDMSDKKQRMKGRALVGMVFQYPEYQLFEETVEKDIAYGPMNLGLSAAEADVRVREAMELVGLDHDEYALRSPFDLSGGEKRRAALAGIIAMRPKYLVLDEPMAGLDPSGRARIMATIDSLRQGIGCAVVMVSHSMEDVALYADRIALLSHGELRLTGTPAEVFIHPELMRENGLELPAATQLAEALRARGLDVPRGIYRMDELKAFILGRRADV